jgi:hypothetical protein
MYKYHVFLSYRRHKEWPQWVENIFLPIFEHWLGEELGKDVQIFRDVQIETGMPWPERLGEALASSRVLVPLLSRQYFNSHWCQTEFALMKAREAKFNLGEDECANGLIIPAIIHDGDDFPDEVKRIQSAKLQDFTNIRMAKHSLTEEKLSEKIRSWVPDVVKAIQCAPPYNPTWQQLAIDQFIQQFKISMSQQTTVPSLI